MQRLFAFLVIVSAVLVATFVFAQGKPKPPAQKKDAGAPTAAPDAGAKPDTNPTAGRDGGTAKPATSAGAATEKSLDGGGKSFRFGEVEIEGRLRSPQIVYFLRRVRAEFAAGDLGHRSFMLELSETRKTPNF